MTLCGVEMGVARNNCSGCHEVAEKHILRSTSLVGRNDIFESCDPGDSILKLEERC